MFVEAPRPPDKTRFLAALNRQQTDEVPYFETEFSPGITGAILGKPVNVRSYLLSAHDYLDLLRRTGIDVAYLHVPSGYGRRSMRQADGRVIYTGGALATREDLKRVPIPDLDPVKARIETFLEAAGRSGAGWMYALDSAGGIASAMGYENYYLSLHEDPGFVEEVLEHYESYALPLTETVLGYKPDAVLLSANICGKNGLTMSLEDSERFVVSRLRRQMALIADRGVPAVIHSDGDNSEVMDVWVDLGFAGFHPVEPTGCFDIYRVKKRWGDRIALFGNIDVGGVLRVGTPEEVYRDTRTHLEGLSDGGGYVCGSSHDIDDNVPMGNLKAMIEAVLSWKRDRGARPQRGFS